MIVLITYSESKTGDFKLLYINEFKINAKLNNFGKKRRKLHTRHALLLLRYYLFLNRYNSLPHF